MATAKKYIAGCCRDCANRKARLSNLKPNAWVSIDSQDQIMGIKNLKVLVCQQLRNSREGYQLIQRMQLQGFDLSTY